MTAGRPTWIGWACAGVAIAMFGGWMFRNVWAWRPVAETLLPIYGMIVSMAVVLGGLGLVVSALDQTERGRRFLARFPWGRDP